MTTIPLPLYWRTNGIYHLLDTAFHQTWWNSFRKQNVAKEFYFVPFPVPIWGQIPEVQFVIVGSDHKISLAAPGAGFKNAVQTSHKKSVWGSGCVHACNCSFPTRTTGAMFIVHCPGFVYFQVASFTSHPFPPCRQLLCTATFEEMRTNI